MALSKAQEQIWTKARSLGSGAQAVNLDDAMCAYLVGRIALDLELQDEFHEVPPDLAAFFVDLPAREHQLAGRDARVLFERLVGLDADADTYFACLASLLKARLKYEMILETQPVPTVEQVGPRGLLQYGRLSAKALAAWLFWRKWFFDIDNRAGQETGYLFEPVIAYSIGGTPVPANRSPVKRHRDGKKGRQVDCLRDDHAYEIKIRVTIAASGQGRWREELDFPLDCTGSGYTPVLVVLDGTPNPKLKELCLAFTGAGGEAYVGEQAWQHLDDKAGPTMSRFLENYVREPIGRILEEAPGQLPDLRARVTEDSIVIDIGGESLHVTRQPGYGLEEVEADMPDDVIGDIPS